MKPLSGFQLAQRQAEAYETHSGIFMAPSAKLIVDSMRLHSGDAVLDLACGTGLIARYAWPAVAPQGRVVAVDVNPAMLAVAQPLMLGAGIEWLEASATELSLESNSFSHVGCQQGVQFFPDAAAAVREVHRVLRPGGSFRATIWATPGHNPYSESQLALLSEVDETVSPSAQKATPAHADQTLTDLARNAGFAQIDVTLLEHTVDVADLKSFFLNQTASTPWGPVLRALTELETAELVAAMATRVDAHRTVAGGYSLPFASYQLTAIR